MSHSTVIQLSTFHHTSGCPRLRLARLALPSKSPMHRTSSSFEVANANIGDCSSLTEGPASVDTLASESTYLRQLKITLAVSGRLSDAGFAVVEEFNKSKSSRRSLMDALEIFEPDIILTVSYGISISNIIYTRYIIHTYLSHTGISSRRVFMNTMRTNALSYSMPRIYSSVHKLKE